MELPGIEVSNNSFENIIGYSETNNTKWGAVENSWIVLSIRIRQIIEASTSS